MDCGLSEDSLKWIKLAKQKFIGDPFSQLRTLVMTVHDEDHKAISMVAVHSLTRVCLRCTRLQPVAWDWVTDTLPKIAPSVAHLEINILWMNKWSGVSRYSALEHLVLRTGCVEPRFWESLASCRLLESMVLVHCTDVGEGEEEWNMEYVHFPALRTFRMRKGHPRVTLRLIIRSRMPVLGCLSWDKLTGPGNNRVQGPIAEHLKLHSPKLDIDRMYALNNGDDTTTDLDNDDDCW